jgi:hypothetical protein
MKKSYKHTFTGLAYYGLLKNKNSNLHPNDVTFDDVQNIVGKPIRRQHNKKNNGDMGVVTDQKIIDDRLYITCSIDDECHDYIKKGENKLSIGFTVPRDKNDALNTQYEINEVSITSNPVHKSCYIIVENSNDENENILKDKNGKILKNNFKIFFSSDEEIHMETQPPVTTATTQNQTTTQPPVTQNQTVTQPPITQNQTTTQPPVGTNETKPTIGNVIDELTNLPLEKQKAKIEDVVRVSETLKNGIEKERKEKEMYLSKIKEFKKNEALSISHKLEKLKDNIPPTQYSTLSKLEYLETDEGMDRAKAVIETAKFYKKKNNTITTQTSSQPPMETKNKDKDIDMKENMNEKTKKSEKRHHPEEDVESKKKTTHEEQTKNSSFNYYMQDLMDSIMGGPKQVNDFHKKQTEISVNYSKDSEAYSNSWIHDCYNLALDIHAKGSTPALEQDKMFGKMFGYADEKKKK